jgi:serine/threonine protein kinase/Flp pilus assembly protein TadD
LIPESISNAVLRPEVKNRVKAAIDRELSGLDHLSHYRILRRLGAGGMGEVFLAEDTKLGRNTALKIIRPEVATNFERKKRFLREARSAAALTHPGIATIYEIGEAEGKDYIAMEYIQGTQLSSLISAKPLDPEVITKIGKQIAEALAEAHERGILHRDLKPENIQITSSGQVKILDFGLAKFLDSRLEDDYLTTSERILGTIPYMSPEQVDGQVLDQKSDIFSLGSILFEMATGRAPFTGSNTAETLENIMHGNPSLISSLNKEIPEGLQKVIYKCLQKNPDHRYSSARQIAADLQEVHFAETVDLEKPFAQSRPAAKFRIAVFYFENLSEERESDYFRAGMTEDIITELSKVRSWEVRPRTQVLSYKDRPLDIQEAGRELKVTHIVQGSIRKSGNRLRISAQLVDAANASSVWGERYDRDLNDIFEIQAEIAQQIAAALKVHLSGDEKREITRRPTPNLQAYDLYLRGREMIFRLTRAGVDSGIEYFQRAISIDPGYALAHAGLAQALALKLSFFGGSEDLAEQSIASANKALALDSNLSQALTALGLAYLLKRMSPEAVEACRRAIELNPQDAFAAWISGRLAYRLNNYREAIRFFSKTIQLVPDFYTGYSDLAQAYQNLDLAEEAMEARRATIKACRDYLSRYPDEARAYIFLATASAWAGDLKGARAAGEKAEALSPDDPVMMYNLACLYSVLNDQDRAVEWLSMSIQHGRRDFEWMKRDPALENIRNHPRYLELLK